MVIIDRSNVRGQELKPCLRVEYLHSRCHSRRCCKHLILAMLATDTAMVCTTALCVAGLESRTAYMARRWRYRSAAPDFAGICGHLELLLITDARKISEVRRLGTILPIPPAFQPTICLCVARASAHVLTAPGPSSRGLTRENKTVVSDPSSGQLTAAAAAAEKRYV